MGGRPWLEALKEHSIRRDQDQEETREAVFADAPGGEPTKPTKVPAPVANMRTTRAPRDGDERRLIAAGWTPKERLGLVIWANPESGFYCSREVALHRLTNPLTVSPYRRLLKALGRSGRAS